MIEAMGRYILGIIILCFAYHTYGQNKLGFEKSIPEGVHSDNSIHISSKHAKWGNSSLEWNWNAGGVLRYQNRAISQEINRALSVYHGGMLLWVYNTKAIADSMQLSLTDETKHIKYHFYYHLNFTGWRACWIRFNDMIQSRDLDQNGDSIASLQIKAPMKGQGVIYLDRLSFPTKQISDRATPDAQLPYINSSVNNNHWAALHKWWSHNPIYWSSSLGKLSVREGQYIDQIRQRIEKKISSKAMSETQIDKVREEFLSLKIRRDKEGNIQGPALMIKEEIHTSENGDRSIKEIETLLYHLAYGWSRNHASDFDTMFLDLWDWMIDQGFDIESGMGTNHHYGYSFRKIPIAIHLMKNVLKKHHQLEKAFHILSYWAGIAEIYETPICYQGIADAWNTMINERLEVLMLLPNSEALLNYLNQYSKWLSQTMLYSPGIMGGFKPDGTGFHHGMFYPAYLNGAYSGLGNIIYLLHNTPWQVSIQAQSNFKRALITLDRCCYRGFVPLSLSGRHPMKVKMSKGVINAFGYLAKEGNPKTGEKIDGELARIYLRLTDNSSKGIGKYFKDHGIGLPSNSSGSYSYNYAALNMYWYKENMVSVKGYNNIVTGTEIYPNANRYGKYQGYGAVEIFSPIRIDKTKKQLLPKGWDWNFVPGATTINVPFNILDCPKINDRSTQLFSGACSLNNNSGIWAMDLKESKKHYASYWDDFVAKKSVFLIEDQIVCLGSNITTKKSPYEVVTTLFQNSCYNEQSNLLFNGMDLNNDQEINTIPIKKGDWFMDTYGTGYVMLNTEDTLKYSCKKQISPLDNVPFKKNKFSKGILAKAWLNHGIQPKNDTYAYVIKLNSSSTELEEYSRKTISQKNIQIISQDSLMHAIYIKDLKWCGIALFHEGECNDNPWIISSSDPLLFIAKQNRENVDISVVCPEIQMRTPTKLVSSESVIEKEITLSIKGNYILNSKNSNVKDIKHGSNSTIITLTIKHGMSANFQLR